jgi:hypothetical protein
MNEYTSEDAWFLLAAKYAQGKKDFASKKNIVEAGDYINHAIFLESEIDHAITVLSNAGLLQVNGDNFSIGPSFAKLWEKSDAEKHRSVQKQLEKLKHAMGIA